MKIEFTSFAMAEMFGLRYDGSKWDGEYDTYKFSMYGKKFTVSSLDMWIEDENHAKTVAGDKVLEAIGRSAAAML